MTEPSVTDDYPVKIRPPDIALLSLRGGEQSHRYPTPPPAPHTSNDETTNVPIGTMSRRRVDGNAK